MKKKVISLLLAAIMVSTSVDATALANQASDVNSVMFMEEETEVTQEAEQSEVSEFVSGGG